MKRERRVGKRLTGADWTILALTACVAIGGGYWATGRYASEPTTEPIAYTLCISALDPRLLENAGEWETLIPKNAPVTSSNGAIALGKVVSLRVEGHPSITVQKGKLIFSSDERLVDLYVRVSADATSREGDGLRVGDVRIAAADTGDFRVGAYLAHGARVVSVERGVME